MDLCIEGSAQCIAEEIDNRMCIATGKCIAAVQRWGKRIVT